MTRARLTALCCVLTASAGCESLLGLERTDPGEPTHAVAGMENAHEVSSENAGGRLEPDSSTLTSVSGGNAAGSGGQADTVGAGGSAAPPNAAAGSSAAANPAANDPLQGGASGAGGASGGEREIGAGGTSDGSGGTASAGANTNGQAGAAGDPESDGNTAAHTQNASSIQTESGLCVTVAADDAAMNSPLLLRTCTGDASQRFTRDQSGHFHAGDYLSRVLQLDAQDSLLGSQLVVANEPDVSFQGRWEFQNAELIADGGLCLGPQPDTGRVQALACLELEMAGWQLGVTIDNEIVFGSLCADVPSSIAAEGAGMQFYPCHGGANQRFVLEASHIRYESMCFTVPGKGAPGSQIVLLQCVTSGAESQRFRLRGQIVTDGRCLTAIEQDRVELRDCDGAPEQTWTWRF